ncbi:MAG: C4-type zinc ribbon domain-containing protein [Chloroflexi bacterium]|nr:C4-type zinc ribbon domain-containing protein [Chloroflexota bacterium]MDA1227628.1 C4-type zinc ribbon domain-containing protein [Chloroflexota bacterium]
MVSTKQLYDLQETDTEMAEKDAALKDVQARLADDRPIAVARQKAGQLEAQVEAQSKARNGAQLAAQQVQEKVKNVERKLYGGGITNARELTAFEEELGYLQAQLAEEEDSLLELMVVVEDLQVGRDDALKTLESLEAQRESQLPLLRQSQEALEKDLAQLLEARKQLTPNIPPQQMAIYESLRRTRGGQAVAKLDRARGVCQACRIALPATDLQKAKASAEIVQCNSCRRILYVE